MENPLLIAKRKFDMRQWVLVTDWNPLNIYFFNEFYVRFSVEEYVTDESALDNAYIHLVNNSIGKNSENFGKVVCADNGEAMEGYMWSYQMFTEYVKYLLSKREEPSFLESNPHLKNSFIAGTHMKGEDIVVDRIQHRMKEIAKSSLMCASEMIEHRKNSWELYGFDFMVDDQFNAWLIEINSSPACDYSTKVTERYVQKALVELLSVVLDVRAYEQMPKKDRGDKGRPDTGGWECIYKGSLLETPASSFGVDMVRFAVPCCCVIGCD
jgi:hypothetical protein